MAIFGHVYNNLILKIGLKAAAACIPRRNLLALYVRPDGKGVHPISNTSDMIVSLLMAICNAVLLLVKMEKVFTTLASHDFRYLLSGVRFEIDTKQQSR